MRNGADNSLDLPTATIRDGGDEFKTGLRKDETYLTTITPLGATNDQFLADQAVTHSSRRRGSDANCLGEFRHVLCPPRRQHDERSVLGQRDVFSDVGQRTRRHRNENSAGRQDRINHGIGLLV